MIPYSAAVAIAVAVTYVEASIPIAYLLGRLRRVDLRELGTGNPGTANLFRNAGFWPAAVAGPLTFAQGLSPLALARLAGWGEDSLTLLAIAAALGNGYSFLLSFHGGRVAAAGTGITAGLCPPAFLVLLACFGGGAILRNLPIATLAGFILAVPLAWLTQGAAAGVGSTVVLAVLAARRLDGLTDDLHSGDPAWRVLVGRLVLDRRPRQRLVGPR